MIYQKNLGYGDALIEGINRCNTEYFCIFNADGSFDPSELKKILISELSKGNLIESTNSKFPAENKNVTLYNKQSFSVESLPVELEFVPPDPPHYNFSTLLHKNSQCALVFPPKPKRRLTK